MSDCCTSPGCDGKNPKKGRCPATGKEYAEVSVRTITHHVKASWSWTPTARHYYFCDDPVFDIAYFGDDGSIIPKSGLRTRIGIKERNGDDFLCYCFGVSRADFVRDPAIKNFVIAQTKAGLCSCETSNPSGRCCLRKFPSPQE